MPSPTYSYHRFSDRAAFAASAKTADPNVDTARPVGQVAGGDVMEVGTVADAGSGAPLPGFHVCAAWRGAVPNSFLPSQIVRPAGAMAFAGQPEAESGAPAVPPAAFVPQTISIRQFLLQGEMSGLLTKEEALAAAKTGTMPPSLAAIVAGMPDAELRWRVEMDWASMIAVDRASQLLTVVGAQVGMGAAQWDAFFTAAGQL